MSRIRVLLLVSLVMFFSIVFAAAQVQWTKCTSNPIISPGQISPGGTMSCYWQTWMPTVMYDEGLYRMWFVGDGYAPDRVYSFGYAISEDGIDWFQYAKNPVLIQGSTFDDRYMWGGTVIKDGNLYRLYFGGYSSLTQKWSIGMATSTDRIHWSKLSTPVLTGGGTGSWDINGVSQPCVIKEATGQYKMWYGGSTNQSTTAIGFATSTDGVVWEKYSGNPILSASPGISWESYLLSDARVVKVGSLYHMFYFGANSSSLYQIGYASSENGIQWQRYVGNPVVRPGSPGTWDDYTLSAHWVMWQDSTFKLWYAGRTSEGIFQLGYATSPLAPTDVKSELTMPSEFSLRNNYPNPFNPSTTMEFDVPREAQVELRIFNALGAQVALLANEKKSPGIYSVTWDASRMASGTYWARLTADGRSLTQKMILLK